jgi:hypothetical protein
MWEYGNHLCIEDVDDGCVTLDCGVEVKFNQSNCVSHCDHNLIEGKLGYVKKIQEIMQVDVRKIGVLVSP